jgi:Secretion system C-terminal sorting domain
MPKIVVLAGINHQVIFTQDDSLDVTAMQSAINNFLNPTVVPQTLMAANAISLFPNPAQNQINISYNLPCSDNLTIDVLNAIGKTVKTITFYNVVAGQHSFNIVFNQELPGGIYFARINHGIKTDILKFTIVH